jgi:hypothetical protein
MTDTNVATLAHAFKVAFRDLAVVLYADSDETKEVSVKFGRPTSFLEPDIVAFGRLSSQQSTGPLSRTNRSREEVLELDVIFSCFKPGGDDAEEEASARAYDLLRMLEYHVRQIDPTIGGTIRECALDRHSSEGMTPQATVKSGRNIFVTATFAGKVRISSSGAP